MSRFEECLSHVLKYEGGYVNHPNDKGGATNHGLTQSVYDDWRISRGFPRQPVSGISKDEVKAIYLARYWILGKCQHLPAPLDLVHFDSGVNHGLTQAAKFLQRALDVADDGVIGPMTLHALKEDVEGGNVDYLCHHILDQREDFYTSLAAKKPSQKVFLKGWMNRITEVRGLVNDHQ